MAVAENYVQYEAEDGSTDNNVGQYQNDDSESDNDSNSDEAMDGFINDDDSEGEDDYDMHPAVTATVNLAEAEETRVHAMEVQQRYEERLADVQQSTQLQSIADDDDLDPVTLPTGPPNAPPLSSQNNNHRGASPPPKEVTASFKPIGPQTVFMPEKPSINISGPVKPALTLALPVWLGVYAHGSLAEIEMAQAVQYILNAATTVQQQDGARIQVTLWCMGRCASMRGMSYKEALKCSANPGEWLGYAGVHACMYVYLC